MILQVQKEAVQSVEQDGMVFIDEIDKIVVGSEMRYGKHLCPHHPPPPTPPVCAMSICPTCYALAVIPYAASEGTVKLYCLQLCFHKSLVPNCNAEFADKKHSAFGPTMRSQYGSWKDTTKTNCCAFVGS